MLTSPYMYKSEAAMGLVPHEDASSVGERDGAQAHGFKWKSLAFVV
jgi:hypothetical protein